MSLLDFELALEESSLELDRYSDSSFPLTRIFGGLGLTETKGKVHRY